MLNRTLNASKSKLYSTAAAASVLRTGAQTASPVNPSGLTHQSENADSLPSLKQYIDYFRSGVTDVDIKSTVKLSPTELYVKPLYHMTEAHYLHKLEKLRSASYISKSLEESDFLKIGVAPGVAVNEMPKLITYCLENDSEIKNVLFLWKLLIGDTVVREYYLMGEQRRKLYLEDMLAFCEKLFQLKAFVQCMEVFKHIYEEYLHGEFVVNAKFLSMYLKVRAGTKIEYSWKELVLNEHDFKKYTLNVDFLKKDVLKVIEYIQEEVLNENGPWALERNSELESNIIYFIAIHQPEMLEQYINHVFFSKKEQQIQPDSKIILSILNSYYHLQDIGKGLGIMNQMIVKYGYETLDLDLKFWHQMFLIGNKAKQHGIDTELEICTTIWQILKKRSVKITSAVKHRDTKNAKINNPQVLQQISCLSCVPFFQILKDSKTKNSNRYELMHDMFEFFAAECQRTINVDSPLRHEERVFMKNVFKSLIKMKLHKSYNSCVGLINQYHFGYKEELLEHLELCRNQLKLERKKVILSGKNKKKIAKNNSLLEDRDLEDRLLGGNLW